MKPHLLFLCAVLALAAGCEGVGDGDGRADFADAGTNPDAGGKDASVSDPCPEVASAPTDPEAFDRVVACLRSETASEGTQDTAIRQFIELVEGRGGFPILDGTDVTFVYVASATWDREDDDHGDEDFSPSRRLEPLRVAGDFNAWQTGGESMKAEARRFFHLTLPVGSGPGRQRYKLVAKDSNGADVWFSDPLSKRFDFDNEGRISIVRGGDAQGHLEWIRSVHATQLNVDRPIWMYVPKGYDGSTARYPVVYMHDGQNLFDTAQPDSAFASWDADGVAEIEIGAGRARPFLIVGIPNNANRMGEYTHVQDDLGPGWGGVVGGDGDKYGHFIFTELKPLIDRRYRTEPAFASTAMLGSSLGGLITYYLGLKYPGSFKYVGGMSSTFDWGKLGLNNKTVPELYDEVADLASRGQVYYLDSGGGPPESGDCGPDGAEDGQDNYCETLQMKAVLEGKGIDTYPLDPNATLLQPENIDIFHWWQAGAEHNEAAWNGRLFRTYRLFFRP